MLHGKTFKIGFDRAFYHVTSRGNAREPIFITDTNRVRFLDKKESASIARIKTPLASDMRPGIPRVRGLR